MRMKIASFKTACLDIMFVSILVCVLFFNPITWIDFSSFGRIALVFAFASIIFTVFILGCCIITHLNGTKFSYVDIFYFFSVIVSVLSFLIKTQEIRQFQQIYVLFFCFLFYIAIRIAYSSSVHRKALFFASCLITISVCEAVRGLFYYFCFGDIKVGFVNVNYFGMYIAIHVPLVLGCLWEVNNKLALKFFLSFVLGILLLTVFLTYCRTTYVALIFTLPILIYARYSQEIKRTFFATYKYLIPIICISLAIILPIFVKLIYLLKPMSFVGRILIWRVSLKMFLNNLLFGIGFQNFSYLYSHYQNSFFQMGSCNPIQRMASSYTIHAFNDYLETITELGIFGSVIFVVLWCGILIKIYNLLRSNYTKTDTLHNGKNQIIQNKYKYRKPVYNKINDVYKSTSNKSKMLNDNNYIFFGFAGSVLCFMIMSLFHYPGKIIPIYLTYNICLACMISKSRIKK